jgi:hypothetical protein
VVGVTEVETSQLLGGCLSQDFKPHDRKPTSNHVSQKMQAVSVWKQDSQRLVSLSQARQHQRPHVDILFPRCLSLLSSLWALFLGRLYVMVSCSARIASYEQWPSKILEIETYCPGYVSAVPEPITVAKG